ncbi:polysaccharide deacetylase family protein [Pseudonocardia kongjuensis]|uniref:Polysaccharide deacetylase family protein n=1 Tax=Pseudonocardia kongjuensis TaxID=102227 RepID=A0ABN1XP41_9PSEU
MGTTVAPHSLLGRAGLRTALVVLAVLAVALPVAGTRWIGDAVSAPPAVRDQQVVPAALDPAAAHTAFADDPAVTARTAGSVLVLSYHEIAPDPQGEFTIAPEVFAEHLAMLRAAGFTSVSADTLLAARTDPSVLPDRPVMITFDDGTGGVWRYADPLLEQYGFRGVAFVITGRVGEHYPYYLTWDELTAMRETGRWDVESHTAAGHDRHDVGGGNEWPFLINRLVTADGTLETPEQARARLTADADTAIATLEQHGHGRPALFAYPFSASLTPSNDPALALAGRDILADRYQLLFTNDSARRWATRADLAAGSVPRIGVDAHTTTDDLFDAIVGGLPAPAPQDADPLDPAAWTVDGDPGLSVGPDGIVLRATTAAGTTARLYRDRAADWRDYTVSGTWTVQRGGYAALLLREGSPGALRISVGHSSMKISTADGVELATARFPDSATHTVTATLTGTRLLVEVDGRPLPVVTVPDPGPGGGGIGLRVGAAPSETTVHGLRVSAS